MTVSHCSAEGILRLAHVTVLNADDVLGARVDVPIANNRYLHFDLHCFLVNCFVSTYFHIINISTSVYDVCIHEV